MHGGEIQTHEGLVEVNTLSDLPVIDGDIKTARCGDDELVQCLVRVTAAIGAGRDIVDVVDTLDVERDMTMTLDERQVAARVLDFRQIDKPPLGRRHQRVSLGARSLATSRGDRCFIWGYETSSS